MTNTESNAAFCFQMEQNQVLNDLEYVKRRIDRMLNLCNEPRMSDEAKYRALAEIIWETADCLDDSF